MGTYDGGLNRFDPATEQFTPYTSQNSGLVSNLVEVIVGDDEGNLRLGTTGGVSRFDPQTAVFKNYDVDEGLNLFENKRGELFYGGVNGFFPFYPDQIRDNPHPPQVALTDFRFFDESLDLGDDSPLQKHVSKTKHITLSYDQNDVSIDYVGLHFTRPERNQYAYMLENYDDDWREVGTQRTATYTNLAPGEYTFRVKASNSDGVWNEEGASIDLTVLPPWWLTWWFRIFGAASFAGILTVGYRYRVGRLLQMQRMRLRIASDLHDDVGSNLSAIAMRSEVLRERAVGGTVQEHELDRLHEAAEETITSLREIIWFVDPKHDRLEDLVGKMRDSAADLLGRIRYTFQPPHRDEGKAVIMHFRRHVFLIFKEALHNVVKHANASEVAIRLDSQDGMFTMEFEDDGVGFDESRSESGHGIGNMRRRADLLNAQLEIKSVPGTGTAITLSVKMA